MRLYRVGAEDLDRADGPIVKALLVPDFDIVSPLSVMSTERDDRLCSERKARKFPVLQLLLGLGRVDTSDCPSTLLELPVLLGADRSWRTLLRSLAVGRPLSSSLSKRNDGSLAALEKRLLLELLSLSTLARFLALPILLGR